MKRQVYEFQPVLMDRMSHGDRFDGREVHIFQPHGCPKNGTFGQVYIQDAATGQFMGMVCKTSLVKTGRTAVVRDLERERRDARDAERAAAYEAARQARSDSMFTVVN